MANVKLSQRLSKEDVRIARKMLKDGWSQQEVADGLGVSQATISRAARKVGAFAKAA